MPVTVYTRSTCAPCKMLKAWLSNKQINYEEKNVDDDPKLVDKIIELTGRMMVPVAVVGDQVIQGFNIGAVSSALAGNSFGVVSDPQDKNSCEGCQ